MTVKVPKVRSRGGKPIAFRSALVPPYVRKTRSLEAALPWLYLKGISTGEMQAALEALVGLEAKGLSSSTVSRLKQRWASEYDAWRQRRWDKDRWVYIWADRIYSGLRADDQRLCALVVIGVNERGEKHCLAIEDGVRESTQSWREVLLGLKRRGLRAPKLAVGDGALGFWAAFDAFVETYEPKYPKAVMTLVNDREVLMTFYDFPATHWQHLRTTNPIESTFACCRALKIDHLCAMKIDQGLMPSGFRDVFQRILKKCPIRCNGVLIRNVTPRFET